MADFHEVIDRAMAASGHAAAASESNLDSQVGGQNGSSGTVVGAGPVCNDGSFLDKFKSLTRNVSLGSSLHFLNGESLPAGLVS